MTCKYKQCAGKTFSNGYCSMHYHRWRRKRKMDGPPNASRKLTDAQIDSIRECPAGLVAGLAHRLGISSSYAYAIRRGARNPVGVG